MGASHVEWAPAVGEAALLSWRGLDAGPAVLDARAFRDGLLGALVDAELLAATAGVVPWFVLPDGQRGVLEIGRARARMGEAPADVRLVYLATHGAVRFAQASASAPVHPSSRSTIGALPAIVVVSLAVVGIAAVVAGAYAATELGREKVRVDGRTARAASVAAEYSKLAAAAVAAGQPVPESIVRALGGLADGEESRPWGLVLAGVAGGAALAAGVGACAWRAARRAA